MCRAPAADSSCGKMIVVRCQASRVAVRLHGIIGRQQRRVCHCMGTVWLQPLLSVALVAGADECRVAVRSGTAMGQVRATQ